MGHVGYWHAPLFRGYYGTGSGRKLGIVGCGHHDDAGHGFGDGMYSAAAGCVDCLRAAICFAGKYVGQMAGCLAWRGIDGWSDIGVAGCIDAGCELCITILAVDLIKSYFIVIFYL